MNWRLGVRYTHSHIHVPERRKPGFSRPYASPLLAGATPRRRLPGRSVHARSTAARVAIGLLGIAANAHAQPDYDTTSGDWNGLRALVSLGGQAGVAIRAPATVEVGSLAPSDALLIVYPTRPLPRADLARFVHAGGRLAIADDYGTGATLLGAFEIGRHAPGTTDASRRLRDNRNLIVAEPRGAHPLTRGVTALMTNHPQVLHHAALAPVATLSGDRGALVLVGAVGAGRLVAIGDASVLINNMLEFPGNRAFAVNLLRYLSQNGRIVIVAGDTPVTGAFDAARDANPLRAIRAEVDRLARVQLPPEGLRALTALIAAVAFLAAITSVPRRAHWSRTTRLATPVLPAISADGAVAAPASRGVGASA